MKIALLCDYGLDDAIATLYLLKNAEKYEQIDILPVGGNFSLQMTMNNAKRILSQIEALPKNVTLVDTSSVPQNGDCLPNIHGADGMGDFLPQEPCYAEKIQSYDAWIDGVDESYVLVSLGPCTVTYDILKKCKVNSVIMMGGNISERPNFGAYEFNHGMDPVAFSECVKFNHSIATLDTCHCGPCDFNYITLKNDGLFERAVKRYVELSNERKEEGCYVYDLVAIIYLMHPERFSSECKEDAFGNRLNVLKYVSRDPIV